MLLKKVKKTNDGMVLPKTAQQSIPFRALYKNGIIETKPFRFSKLYKLNNINFNALSHADQEAVFNRYKAFLNSFSPDTTLQIVVNNRNIDSDAILKSIRCPLVQDDYNEYREEINTMLEDHMHEGKNNISDQKFLVIAINTNSIEEAMTKFAKIDVDIDREMKLIAGNQEFTTEAATSEEYVKVLHDMLNVGEENNLKLPIDFAANERMGMTVKDLISPAGFNFNRSFIRIGEKYAKVLYIKELPSALSTDFMGNLSTLPFNFVANFDFRPIATEEALKKVSNRLTSIRGDVINAQKTAVKSGFDTNLISPNLKFAQEQMEYLQSDLRTGEERLFDACISFMVYADSKEELNENVASLISMSEKYGLIVMTLLMQQEVGFRSVLPLGNKEVLLHKQLTSDAISLFIPFTTRELIQQGGFYYGINAMSKNLIIYNRLKSKNQNGLILGQPGSGKSFSAKREMANVFLTTNDDVYVIDPEAEYVYMARQFGGSVVHLEAGSKYYINPFDMDMNYGDGEGMDNVDPVTMKSDYICMLCETAMGGKYEITSIQRSIIDRVVNQLYRPYKEHMRTLNDPNITCDIAASPTMDDFYDLLMAQKEPEAQDMALCLEIYCRGSFDTFAHRTNVDINNRFIVYDIKNIGNGMKEMGLQVCLNHIWNKIISNQRKGKRTWFYIDEFHILTKTRSSALFLSKIWKRARKWGGVPTAITQNVEDLLTSEESRAIISNCEFILMLSQSPIDRVALSEMYKISETQLTYITNSPPGQGLIYNGEFIIPFIDKFPKNTKLFSIMQSEPDKRK